MYRFLREKIQSDTMMSDIQVFKDDDKNPHYKGKYIAINCLPFSYGDNKVDGGVMNINLHCPRLISGGADREALNKLFSFISELIPFDDATEDSDTLFLGGVHYVIKTQSRPMEDKDDTYFVNLRLKLTF